MTKKTAKTQPDLSFEQEAYQKHGFPIAGIDEAGRGPWAGPVVAAAVILDPDDVPPGLNDSKKLTHATREALFENIMHAAQVGVGIINVEQIDQSNILRATLDAMTTAVRQLETPPVFALIDGNQMPKLPCAAETLVKGDARSCSIAAASIIAKVTRDRLMTDLAKTYPGYGWETNFGYGTKAHQNGLATHGVTPHHRRSFAPIKKLLESAA